MQTLRFTNRAVSAPLLVLLLPLMSTGLLNGTGGSGHTWLQITWRAVVLFDLALLVWAVGYALRTEVVASESGLVLRTLRTKLVPWHDIEAIDVRRDRVTGRRAVLRTSGGTIALPAPTQAFAGGSFDSAIAELRAELTRHTGGKAVH